MDKYEADVMQNAWDEHGWGTVPPGLCQACVKEYWSFNIKEPEPKPDPEVLKAFIKAWAEA